MQAFLKRGLSSLSLSASSSRSNLTTSTDGQINDIPAEADIDDELKVETQAAFTTASEDVLFPKVRPELDGEDCDRDCASCTIRYPAKFVVDLEDKLYGNVAGWATHVLIATDKTDWVRDVADEKGSVMEAVEKSGVKPVNGTLKLSASNMPVPDEYHMYPEGEQPTTALILPAFTIVENVTPALAPDLIHHFVDKAATTTTPLNQPPLPNKAPVVDITEPIEDAAPGSQSPSISGSNAEGAHDVPAATKIPTPLLSRPCPHAAVILLCSQRTRDARCGQSAPLLRREFERHLRPLGLYRDLHDERPGGVGIYFISHVGGHKYSANVMVYRRRDFEWYKKEAQKKGQEDDDDRGDGINGGSEGAVQGIWLARIRPEDCEGIIKYTVLKGKVVKPDTQLRGGFDRERGLISW
ncbi:Sucrase/ferredoxin domain-containing protein [Trichophyton interdigitale]|uniref:Sucrase/ferredoxin domain-containing protein n=1 Tax=Trichophyton interdigitale TaxID=101480 RepID=A0A9P4YF34_9EURO|nr:Sucrase/ferredoxin domain-containing protein [Trichophyton interdigitale]KAF3894078.1 Sucrase/ferredoxin domain-containing protein [Trichophyton interdigitale]KAG8211109.1 Sucrase/ferredoxin domain-containing protein [Trichophyton interdigitale]